MSTNKPFAFRPENFALIPNDVLNYVLARKLTPRDLFVYAYLLTKVGIAKIAFKKPYTAVSVERMSAELGISATTVKASLRSLLQAEVIDRKDTPGFTRTFILVKVVDGRIVRIPPAPRDDDSDSSSTALAA